MITRQFGAGVASLIRGTDIELVCQAETCEQTVKFALACQPDVLLLDVRLAGSDGLRSLEEIKHENPNISVLIFSATEEVKDMAFARKIGQRREYLPKGVSRDELLNTIRRVATGRSAWTTRQIRQVVSRAAAAALAKGDRNPLSAREVQVLEKILLGLSNDAISEELEIDVETVKQHVKHISESCTSRIERRPRCCCFDQNCLAEPPVN